MSGADVQSHDQPTFDGRVALVTRRGTGPGAHTVRLAELGAAVIVVVLASLDVLPVPWIDPVGVTEAVV